MHLYIDIDVTLMPYKKYPLLSPVIALIHDEDETPILLGAIGEDAKVNLKKVILPKEDHVTLRRFNHLELFKAACGDNPEENDSVEDYFVECAIKHVILISSIWHMKPRLTTDCIWGLLARFR